MAVVLLTAEEWKPTCPPGVKVTQVWSTRGLRHEKSERVQASA